MTPISHFPPVAHPETFAPGHWESAMEWADKKLVPVDRWVPHCPYHPYIEVRGITVCERCQETPLPPEP